MTLQKGLPTKAHPGADFSSSGHGNWSTTTCPGEAVTPDHELDALERIQDILSELTAASAVAAASQPSRCSARTCTRRCRSPAGRLGEMGKGVFVAPFRVAVRE